MKRQCLNKTQKEAWDIVWDVYRDKYETIKDEIREGYYDRDDFRQNNIDEHIQGYYINTCDAYELFSNDLREYITSMNYIKMDFDESASGDIVKDANAFLWCFFFDCCDSIAESFEDDAKTELEDEEEEGGEE